MMAVGAGGWQVQRNRLIFRPRAAALQRLQDRRDFFPSPDQFYSGFFFFFDAALTAACVSRGEAVPLRLGGLRLEVRPLRRAHAPLPEAHGPPTLPVSEVRPGLFQVGPPGPAHEETLMRLHGRLKPLFLFLNSYFEMNKNQNSPSGCWRATRHAVAFTARVGVPPEARLYFLNDE